MTEALRPGEVRAGHVLNRGSVGPVQAAVATFDAEKGARLLVPYLHEGPSTESPQFVQANDWFRMGTQTEGPGTLLFESASGPITLTGTAMSRASHGNIPEGELRAHLWIHQKPRTFQDEYRVRDFMSTIDGLEEFADFRSLDYTVNYTETGHKIDLSIEASDVVQWEHDGFVLRIRSNVAWAAKSPRTFEIKDVRPFLESSRSEGATVDDHLTVQWPVRALLLLIHGAPLAWRSHHLRDNEFPTWMMDGHAEDPSYVAVLVSGTVAQHALPESNSRDLRSPMVGLSDIGSAGMRRWMELYSNDNFRRAVEPAVEVVNGATRFLEPQLMMLAISLDRFGHYRFGDGKRRPMHENIRRCLEDAGLEWPEIGSQAGIASAITHLNNDLKHPDRATYPDGRALGYFTRLARVIARCQLFDLLALPANARDSFMKWGEAGALIRELQTAGLRVDDEGSIEGVDD